MSAQLSLTTAYRPKSAGEEAWQRQLTILRKVVEHLGRKEVAYELDVGGSQLSDSLNERDRKHWQGEWTQIVKAMLAQRYDETSRDLLRQVLEADAYLTPFTVRDEDTITPEEMALYERVKSALARKGRGK